MAPGIRTSELSGMPPGGTNMFLSSRHVHMRTVYTAPHGAHAPATTTSKTNTNRTSTTNSETNEPSSTTSETKFRCLGSRWGLTCWLHLLFPPPPASRLPLFYSFAAGLANLLGPLWLDLGRHTPPVSVPCPWMPGLSPRPFLYFVIVSYWARGRID